MSAPHHSIAELVHHLHEGLIHDLFPALGDTVHLCVSIQTVSTWHEETKLLIHTCASKRELIHLPLPVRNIASRNISTFCLFVRNMSTDFGHLPVIGNMSINWNLAIQPFL